MKYTFYAVAVKNTLFADEKFFSIINIEGSSTNGGIVYEYCECS